MRPRTGDMIAEHQKGRMAVVRLLCSPNAHTRKGGNGTHGSQAAARSKRMALMLLGSATRSVLDFVRTGPSNMRLAIAYSDRSTKAMHSSQVAMRSECVPFRVRANEQAWKDHIKLVLVQARSRRRINHHLGRTI